MNSRHILMVLLNCILTVRRNNKKCYTGCDKPLVTNYYESSMTSRYNEYSDDDMFDKRKFNTKRCNQGSDNKYMEDSCSSNSCSSLEDCKSSDYCSSSEYCSESDICNDAKYLPCASDDIVCKELRNLMCQYNKQILQTVEDAENELKKYIQSNNEVFKLKAKNDTKRCSDGYLNTLLEQITTDGCKLPAAARTELLNIQKVYQDKVSDNIEKNINSGIDTVTDSFDNKNFEQMIQILVENPVSTNVDPEISKSLYQLEIEFDEMSERHKAILRREAANCEKLNDYLTAIDNGIATVKTCQTTGLNNLKNIFVKDEDERLKTYITNFVASKKVKVDFLDNTTKNAIKKLIIGDGILN